jgi:hypothetical protein
MKTAFITLYGNTCFCACCYVPLFCHIRFESKKKSRPFGRDCMLIVVVRLSFNKYYPASLVKEVIKEKIKPGIVCCSVH